MDEGKIRLQATGKTNIIAATAVARGDLRAISPEQIERTRAKMRAIVAQSLPGAKAAISFDEDAYPPMPPTAGNRALLGRLNAINRDLGLAEMGELDPAQARRRRHQLRRAGRRRAGRARFGERWRPYSGRNGRCALDLQAGQARGDPDEPACRRAALSGGGVN